MTPPSQDSKPAIRTYRDLLVWQRGMDLVEECHNLSKLFPSDEKFGLTAQLRRASVSIPANIAEGHGRRHRGDFVRSLSYSSGSVKEVETHLLIAVRLKYVQSEAIEKAMRLCEEIGRMLAGLIRKLGSSAPTAR